MKVGVYYHIPGRLKDGKLLLPDYYGIFIESLAQEVQNLLIIFHEVNSWWQDEINYEIQSKNIELLSLGKKTKAWHRSLFNQTILKPVAAKINECDALIIRSPSPLAPYFHKFIKKSILFYMIVGDYEEGAKHLRETFRGKLVKVYVRHNHRLFLKVMMDSNVIVNSNLLYQKFSGQCKTITMIKTTTLRNCDFFSRKDTCNNDKINLLYTGRIDSSKGLFELLDALSLFKKENLDVNLNIGGWEEDEIKPVQESMLKHAKKLGVEDRLIFHGKKTIGDELNSLYRLVDIYVIPSHHEGFPRTIWEAMANSLPVIASNVGGIPHFLRDKKDALLIQPKSAIEIYNAILLLLNNPDTRQTLIRNGYEKAKENTVDVQGSNLIDHIKKTLSPTQQI